MTNQPARTLTIIFCILALFLASTSLYPAEPAAPPAAKSATGPKDSVVLIMRHAEKPETGFTLSDAGERRSQALVKYFENLKLDSKPVHLDYLIATADSDKSHRPRLTVEPLAKSLNLKPDTRFSNKQVAEMARDLQSGHHNQTILICWHHGEIPELLQSLGADPSKLLPDGKWPTEQFSWLIELRFDQDGHLVESKRTSQHLMPGDSE